MQTWQSPQPPPRTAISPLGWALAALRGAAIALLIGLGLALLLTLRLAERPLFGLRRPVTPFITQGVCRATLRIMGVRLMLHGQPMVQRGALVANHASWLDIFALNAAQRVYFVSKEDVAGWPGIGWLARATGTLFIRRHGRDAARQKLLFEARLRAGHRLLFFPEGTSTDSLRVLPFKTALFAAFFAEGLRHLMHVQPVSVVYHAPDGADPRLYGWWGDMEFGSHFLSVLARWRQGRIELVFHPPHAVADAPDRKALAACCAADVRAGLERARRAAVRSS